MMPDRGSRWQTLAVALITVVATLVAAWLAIGRDVVTSEEVRRIVVTEAPYVRDRQLLQSAVNTNNQAVAEMRSELNAIHINQAVMTSKLDAILRALALKTNRLNKALLVCTKNKHPPFQTGCSF